MIHCAAMKIGSRRPCVWGLGLGLGLAVFPVGSKAAGPASPSPAASSVASPVASSVASPPPASRESLATVRKLASAAQKLLVIEFSAEWCSPCKQFEKDVLPKESVRVALSQVQFVRYDAESTVGREAVQALHVEGYPTFVALRTDGDVVSILQGFQTEAEFVRWLHRVAPDFEPSDRLMMRARATIPDAEGMLLWGLRLRKRGELLEAADWLARARAVSGATSDVVARADWELRRLRLRNLIPRQQLGEYLQQFPSGPDAEEAARALLRLGPLDALGKAAMARYLDGLLRPETAERVNQLIYRLLRAQAFAEAERAARYLLTLDGKSPYYLDTLAEVFHLRGEPKEALKLSSQALASPQVKESESLRQSLSQNRARFERSRREPPAELLQPDDELQPWEKD